MKPENWTNASQASQLLANQRRTWPLAGKNYHLLENVQVKTFDMGGFTIRAQFNPARVVSSGAKVDAKSVKARKCFLCQANLPLEQDRLPFGNHYLILCNPYPIFPEHFTIPTREHTPQSIIERMNDFLQLTQSLAPFTVFYNGPRCGASAPDHAHFQAVTREVMPLDKEVSEYVLTASPYKESEEASLYLLTGYLRNGFILKGSTQESLHNLFNEVYEALPVPNGETEPMMNLFGSYIEKEWILTLIPRKRHRPWQYEAEGDDHILSSPGAADIGGLFITPLEKDFKKINPDLLLDIYQQVCLSDEEIMTLVKEKMK